MTEKQSTTKKSPSNGMIHKQLTAIMADIEAIGKNRQNVQQQYSFRGIDDVYLALHPLLKKHDVIMLPEILEIHHEERQSRSGGTLIYCMIKARYHYTAKDGSSIPCTVAGEGMDSGDKSTNKAMSAAQKYALIQTFLIPTDEPKDSEVDSPEVEPRKEKPKKDEPITQDQVIRINDLIDAIVLGGTDIDVLMERIQTWIFKKFSVSKIIIPGGLSQTQAKELIPHLEKEEYKVTKFDAEATP